MGRRRHNLTFSERINLNPEIGRGLLAVFLFVVAILSALSFFSLAGVAGQFIDSLLAIVFGQVRFTFPIIILIIGILLIKDLEYEYQSTHTLGAVLFFISFNGIVHIQNPVKDMLNIALTGYGGGMAGVALAWPLGEYLGYWGGMTVLIGLLVISFIFLFNASLAHFVHLNKQALIMMGWGGQQIVQLFSRFRNKKDETVQIAGDFQESDDEPAIDEEDEEKRVFAKRTIVEKNEQDENEGDEEVKEEKAIVLARPKIDYNLPSLELLFTSKSKPAAGDIKGNSQTIKNTFNNFGIEVDMGEIRVGPTVTQYSLKPASGIKVSRITALSNDLALALAAHPIRIEAPIPGKSLIGIEVPNEKVAMVTLRELLESTEHSDRKHNMTVALGKDVAGKVWFGDLPKMPHLLIAGSTGSGKTVCINTVILSLLFQNNPDTLRMIMVDPKRVELTLYNGIPHLLTPVITDPAKTVNALKWTIGEMERRFDVLAKNGNRDILSYNQIHVDDPMPNIVFIIDELADLMATSASEVETGIIRIAQMARAVGIHLIVATQRPSVEVITGLMKANIPARIAFSVASVIDSRTILDCPGAEKLLGRGDMLFLTADLSKPKRIQGAYVSEDEMKHVVKYLREQGGEPVYDESIVSKNTSGSNGTLNIFGGSNDDVDSMFDEAKQCVIESGKASASLLQRRLKIGYARAARLLDEMEEAGIVGPADGAKPREVFSEHIMPSPEKEMPEEEQTMNAGGTVFNSPAPIEPKVEQVEEEV